MHIEFVADTNALIQQGSPVQQGSLVDADALRRFAASVEANGFDGVHLGKLPEGHDATGLASYLLHTTTHLDVLAQHDASLVAPDIAAQQVATLDRLSRGRLKIAVVLGENGDHGHKERLERLDEYLVLLKRLWSNDKAFDHEGRFFRISGAFAAAKPYGHRRVPVLMGGLSGTAVKVAARHADIFALPPSTVAETRVLIERVRAASACHRRADAIRFSYRLRAVVAPTRTEAWAKAREQEQAAGSSGDATLVAGTPEQVRRAILDYHAIGISHFILHGLATAEQAELFGGQVIPLVRHASSSSAPTATGLRESALHFPWRRYRA